MDNRKLGDDVITHSPRTTEDLVGIHSNIEKVNEFIYDFQKSTLGHKKACLLHGHQGSGKTSTVECVARQYNFPLVEVNGSELRTKDALIEALESAITTTPFNVRYRLVLIDEADGLDRRAIAILPELFKRTKHPIFLTANDDYPLKSIETQVVKVQYFRHKPITISNILRGYTNDEQCIAEIVEYADGDIRSALGMMNSVASKMYSEEQIFFVVDKILKGESIDGHFNIQNDALLDWIEENIQYRNLGISFLLNYQNTCNAARLLRKSSAGTKRMLVDNCTLNGHFHINEFIKTMPSSFNAKSRDLKEKRDTIESLSQKLPLHTRAKFETDMLPMLQRLAKNETWLKDVYFKYLYGDEKPINEIALLLGVPKDDIAVTSFFFETKDKKVEKEEKVVASQMGKIENVATF